MIYEQSDADELKSCKTIKGNVNVDWSFPGDLNLDGIEEIQGNLTCGDSPDHIGGGHRGRISSISSSTLQSLENTFLLEYLPYLDTVSLPALTSVKTIDWNSLRKLKTVDFGAGLDKAGNIMLTGTGLTDVSPFATKKVDKWSLEGHASLEQANLSKITTYKKFSASNNAANLTIDLSGVTAAGSTSLDTLEDVNLELLESTTGELEVGNFYNPLLAFPALRHASKIDLQLADDLPYQTTNVKNLSFPVLQTVHGDFEVRAKGTKWVSYIHSNAGLSATIIGLNWRSFFSISLPALEGVDGKFSLLFAEGVNCSVFSKFEVSGSYDCETLGKTSHYKSNNTYSNSAPDVSVGLPEGETFGNHKNDEGDEEGSGKGSDENNTIGHAGLSTGLCTVALLLTALAFVF